MRLTRKQVYDVVDSERDFQDRHWEEKAKTDTTGVGNFLTAMATHLRRAQDEYSDSTDTTDALAYIRNVVATGVWCMECHGAQARKD